MASFSRFSLLLLILTISIEAHLSFPVGEIALKSTDIHDVLSLYGLPKGLLPHNVKSYTLSDDGSFEIKLESSCYVLFTSLVFYDKIIKGKLSYGSVADISGIQSKKFFAWFPLTGIKANPDRRTIEFQVGFLSETLPVEMFADIPSCRKKPEQGRCLGQTTEPISSGGNNSFSSIFILFI